MPRTINLSDPKVHERIQALVDLNIDRANALLDLFKQPYEQRSGVSAQNIKDPVEGIASAIVEIRDVLDGTIEIGN